MESGNSPLGYFPLSERLRKELASRQQANPLYSLRAFSRDLQIDFSILSRMLNGKLPYTKKLVLRISQQLPLSSEEVDFYLKNLEMKKMARKQLAVDAVHPALYMPNLATLTLNLKDPETNKHLLEIESFIGKTLDKKTTSGSVGLYLAIFELPV